MSTLVADCPRCGAKKITFEVKQQHYIGTQYKWQQWYEIFCICRNCNATTTFVVSQKDIKQDAFIKQKDSLTNFNQSINNIVNIETFVSLRDQISIEIPQHLPENIKSPFQEGVTCFAVKCFNASSTMFRKCIDLATRAFLPEADIEGLKFKQRQDLGLRLKWLFDNKKLPEDLRELSSCIREDGNDGAHNDELEKEEANDLLDFTTSLLERIYTEPTKLKLAKDRRDKRRQNRPT